MQTGTPVEQFRNTLQSIHIQVFRVAELNAGDGPSTRFLTAGSLRRTIFKLFSPSLGSST